MLLSLILYGSRARGDHRQRSDVDLLGVVESSAIHREVTARGASFYHYPSHTLIAKAESGDLFALHLVEEGIVLHDTVDFFEKVRSSFRFREDYKSTIKEAQAVLRFLRDRRSLIDKPKVRKRMVWAMRTIIIARAAEKRSPVFASKALELFSGIAGLKDVIDNRNTVEARKLLEASQSVEEKFGVQVFAGSWPDVVPAQVMLMKRIGGVAQDTLKFVPSELQAERIVEGGGGEYFL